MDEAGRTEHYKNIRIVPRLHCPIDSEASHRRGKQRKGSLMSEHLLSTPTVAQITGLSQVTLRRWRSTGGGPRFVRLGRAVRYRSADVTDFVSARTYKSTSEADVMAQEVAVR